MFLRRRVYVAFATLFLRRRFAVVTSPRLVIDVIFKDEDEQSPHLCLVLLYRQFSILFFTTMDAIEVGFRLMCHGFVPFKSGIIHRMTSLHRIPSQSTVVREKEFVELNLLGGCKFFNVVVTKGVLFAVHLIASILDDV